MNAKRIEENLRDASDAGVQLLLTDADIALTFLDAAKISANKEGRSRRIHEARKAYDSILHLMTHLKPDPAQLEVLNKRISKLRQRLIEAGGLER